MKDWLKITLLIAAAVLAAGGAYLISSGVAKGIDPLGEYMIFNPINNEGDKDISKNQAYLKPDITTQIKEGETVLHVGWGDTEDTFKYEIMEEGAHSVGGPSNGAFAKNGEIYVYDSVNTALKVFKNNKFIRMYDFREEYEKAEGFTMGNLAVTDSGTVYGFDAVKNRIVRVINGKIEYVTKPGAIGLLIDFRLLPNGEISIADGPMRIRRLNENGKATNGSTMGVNISESKYEYADGEGNGIGITELGFKSYQISLVDKNEKVLGSVNFTDNIYEEADGFPTGFQFIGTDAAGNIYGRVMESQSEKTKQPDYEGREYIVRINIRENKIDTIRIKPNFVYSPTKINMYNSTLSTRSSTQVNSDGNIYKLYMDQESGYSIVKYTFN